MKLKHLFLILLAFCTVFFLTGCDSGGGSSSSGGGNGDNDGGGNSGTMTYVVTGLLNTDGTSGLTQIEGGIRYTVTAGPNVNEDYSTLTIDIDNKTFSLYEKEVVDGAVMVDLTYSGTWEQTNSTTISAHCNKSKDTGTGTESPQNWDIVLTIDGNNIHWTSGEPFNWIWTKQ